MTLTDGSQEVVAQMYRVPDQVRTSSDKRFAVYSLPVSVLKPVTDEPAQFLAELFNQPTGQSTNQSINQSINHSFITG